jgi:hypothetical protein
MLPEPTELKLIPEGPGEAYRVAAPRAWGVLMSASGLLLAAGGAWRRGGLGHLGGEVKVLARGPSACWDLRSFESPLWLLVVGVVTT